MWRNRPATRRVTVPALLILLWRTRSWWSLSRSVPGVAFGRARVQASGQQQQPEIERLAHPGDGPEGSPSHTTRKCRPGASTSLLSLPPRHTDLARADPERNLRLRPHPDPPRTWRYGTEHKEAT